MGIELLDCTLRDGGYVNNWNFGRSTAICILERLISAGIDVIEIGFLDESQPFDLNRTIQPDTKCFDRIFDCIDRGHSMLVGMIDYGTCSLEHIAPCNESILDGIRVIFKHPKMYDAVRFGQELSRLGYKVFLQMVSITSYADQDILDFVKLVNEMPPYAVSMVDTYGLMHKEEMIHYFYLLDYNLNPSVHIGYHSHNNFQLAYANTCELLKCRTRHDVLVDGTLYGMGKSAGNAPLELLAMYLNENYKKNYDISQILEAIDANILQIYSQKYWGYNLPYFLAASNDCHPNYINYLLDKKTLSIKAINEIVRQIPLQRKLSFDKSCIEQLYIEYQRKTIQGDHALQRLEEVFRGRTLLILGPGKTLLSHQKEIVSFIAREKPIIVSVNFIPDFYIPDYAFISNSKRYSMSQSRFALCQEKPIAIIATSNLTAINKPFDYVLDYAALLNEEHLIEDNSLIMLLNTLCICKPALIALAGFDGFGKKIKESYYDDYMELSTNFERLTEINAMLKAKISVLSKSLNIVFITPSIYENDGET